MEKMDNLLENMVSQYTEDLFNWAYYKTSSQTTAEDLVQDTFLAAALNIDSFKRDSSTKTWLFSILNHKIIDHYRGKIKQPIAADNDIFSTFFDETGAWNKQYAPKSWDEDEEQLLDDENFQLILKECMDALPEKWNICIKLKYLTERNSNEICQELDIATSNYWQIIHRAKLKLRDCLENNWFNN